MTDDGSTMTVQTGGSVSSARTGGRVEAVRQQDTRLNLDFEDGGTLEIQTAEPTAIAKWLENTKRIHGIVGAIYTPCEDKYDAMDVWARKVAGEGRAR